MIPPARIPFTQAAYDKILSELTRLTKYREEVVLRLTTAREMGDLSENGAYRYAKQELGDVNRQIRQLTLQSRIGYVPKTTHNGTVGFGNVVTIKNEKREITFTLVSKHESNPTQNKLSTQSPIGNAVLGKKTGDEIEVNLPVGMSKYQITQVI